MFLDVFPKDDKLAPEVWSRCVVYKTLLFLFCFCLELFLVLNFTIFCQFVLAFLSRFDIPLCLFFNHESIFLGGNEMKFVPCAYALLWNVGYEKGM